MLSPAVEVSVANSLVGKPSVQNAAAATLTLASLLLHRHLPPTCRFYCVNNESRIKIEMVLVVIYVRILSV